MTVVLPILPPYPIAVTGMVRAGHDSAVIRWIAEFNTQVAALNVRLAELVSEARIEGAIAELEHLAWDAAATRQAWTPVDLGDRITALRVRQPVPSPVEKKE